MKIFSGKWSEEYDRDKISFDLKKDVLQSKSVILYPGRFYILQYMSKTKDVTNTRPVILSLGLSQKDPESFLCLDLCVIPKDIRIKFIEMFYNLFSNEIKWNVERFWEIGDADKQKEIKTLTYQNLFKIKDFKIFKTAIKRYKIKNTKTIYSLLYSEVYKVIGKFADENMFINGNISDVQKDFLKKASQM